MRLRGRTLLVAFAACFVACWWGDSEGGASAARGVGVESPGSGAARQAKAGDLQPEPTPAPRSQDEAHPCDEEQWSKLEGFVEEVRDGEVLIHESDWASMGTETRLGLARWVSKCTQEGRPVRLVGSASGGSLAVYDARRGYRLTMD